MTERITSSANPVLKLIRSLGRDAAARRVSGLMLCEGRKALDEALASGAEPAHVVIPDGCEDPSVRAARVIQTPRKLFDGLSALDAPQPLLFTVPLPDLSLRPLKAARPKCVVLDRLQDPGNVGSVIRTACAMGIDAVLLTPGCADPSNPKTLRASAGTVFRVPIMRGAEEDLLKYLNETGLPVYTTGVSGQAVRLGDANLEGRAVVIGNEGAGVSDFWREFQMLTIPMTGRCESLGAAVAAALIIWEMRA